VKYILDNTVLSNFTLIEKLDLLFKILGDEIYVTNFVKSEFQKRFTFSLENFQFEEIKPEDIEQLTEAGNYSNIQGEGVRLDILGEGELSCIILCITKFKDNAIILTDDGKARKTIKRLELKVGGSIYVLAFGVCKGILSLEEAERLLLLMKKKGFYLKETIKVIDSVIEQCPEALQK